MTSALHKFVLIKKILKNEPIGEDKSAQIECSLITMLVYRATSR